MLEKKCIFFLRKILYSDELQEEELLIQYHQLLKEINASTQIEDLVEAYETIQHFNPYGPPNFILPCIKTKSYSFFSSNQKMSLSIGSSIGGLYAIGEIISGYLQNIFSFNQSVGVFFNYTIRGAATGILLAWLIDHIQEKVTHSFHENIFCRLVDKLQLKINELREVQLKLNRKR